jgi:hypothetical protein
MISDSILFLILVHLIVFIYLLYKKFNTGDPREVEAIIDKVGMPEGYRVVNNKTAHLRIADVLYSLIPSVFYAASEFRILFLTKISLRSRSLYFLDAKYRLLKNEDDIEDTYISAFCFPAPLDITYNIGVSRQSKVDFAWKPDGLSNPGENFANCFNVEFRPKKIFESLDYPADKELFLNSDIVEFLLAHSNNFPFDMDYTEIYLGKDGLILATTQHAEKDKLTEMCRIGEQLVEIVVKCDVICSTTKE